MENRLSTDSTAATYKTQSAKIAVDKPFSIEVVAGMPTHGHGIAHTPSEKIRSWPMKIRRDGFRLAGRLADYPRRLRGRQTPAPNRKGQYRALGFPRSLRRLLWPLLAAGCSLISAAAASDTPVYFTDDEKALILSRGPWPVKIGPDPSNRVSGDMAAIAYGKLLFESADLSIDRGRSCLTCHEPTLGHGDGKPRGIGRVRVDRNTMPLFNLRLNTWYGWDGKSDNLWAQSIASILDPDPVVFLEPKALYRAFREDVPEEMYTVDLSTTRDVVPGDDAVIFCYGAMVPVAAEAARRIKESRSKDVRVVDLRTLMPLDEDAVLQAARDCGRIVIVQEAPRFCGYGSELSAMVAEHAVEYLEAPIKRVTGFDTPFPNTLENYYLPDARRVTDAVEEVLDF